MGYRVEYQPIKKTPGALKKTSRAPAMTAVCRRLFLLVVNSIWPRGKEVLRDVLIPGDAAGTMAALEDFALELRAGEELPSAFETFCRNVIRDAELDSY